MKKKKINQTKAEEKEVKKTTGNKWRKKTTKIAEGRK